MLESKPGIGYPLACFAMEDVAQLAEHRIVAPKVAGSIPVILPSATSVKRYIKI